MLDIQDSIDSTILNWMFFRAPILHVLLQRGWGLQHMGPNRSSCAQYVARMMKQSSVALVDFLFIFCSMPKSVSSHCRTKEDRDRMWPRYIFQSYMYSKSQDDMLRTLLREPRLPKLCPELHMPLQREMPQVQKMFFPAVADGFGPFGPEIWEKTTHF